MGTGWSRGTVGRGCLRHPPALPGRLRAPQCSPSCVVGKHPTPMPPPHGLGSDPTAPAGSCAQRHRGDANAEPQTQNSRTGPRDEDGGGCRSRGLRLDSSRTGQGGLARLRPLACPVRQLCGQRWGAELGRCSKPWLGPGGAPGGLRLGDGLQGQV